MRKKLIVSLLTMSMVASVLSACATKDVTNESKESTVEDSTVEKTVESSEVVSAEQDEELALDCLAGTEITIAVRSTPVENFDGYEAAERIYEDTGIKVNWMIVDTATYKEKTATMLAGDMPDMMIGLVKADTISSDPDLFYDLSEEGLLETYAPDVYEDYNTAGQAAWDTVTWPDGSIRGLLIGDETYIDGEAKNIYFINTAWLDQLGLKKPTTTDELYDVICAFRDNDMNGNGDKTDEIPLLLADSSGFAKISPFANFFGIAGDGADNIDLGKMVKDGKVVSVFDTQQYRDYIEYMHKLMADGLLDVEYFSQSSEQISNKQAAGLAGVAGLWKPTSGLDVEFAKNYDWLGVIKADDDVEYIVSGKKDAFNASIGAAISAETENVEACLWVWNYLSSDPFLHKTATRGPEGVWWEVVDNQIKEIPAAERVFPEGYDASNWIAKTSILNTGHAPFMTADDVEEYIYSAEPVEGDRRYYINKIHDYIQAEYVPSKNLPSDKVEEFNELNVELEAYIDNFVAKSIVEGLTDADWEEHLKQLEGLKYQEWLDWYQWLIDVEF